jgi:hypothetical protein
MIINVDVKYARAIGSWSPIIQKTDKGSLLGNVALWPGDGSLTTMVTDRYRMIYSNVPLSDVVDPVDKPLLVPMDLFTRFVAACKALPDNAPVQIYFDDRNVWLAVPGSGVSLSESLTGGSFPDLVGWVASWVVAKNNVAPNFRWEMKRLADLHKFADPAAGVVTAARRDYGWNATVGDGDFHSAAWRFDQGSPDTFAVYVMPMNVGR